MKRDESVQEYSLAMKELASRGNIEIAALIQYVIDGVTDDPTRMAFLYEATNLKELKKKLDIFDKVRIRVLQPVKYAPNRTEAPGKAVSTHRATTSSSGSTGDAARGVVLRCFNCNEAGHMMSSCPKPRRERGSCYLCGAMDHQKQFCPRRKIAVTAQSTPSPVDSTTRLVEISSMVVPSYAVSVNLDIANMLAVLDTGSPIYLFDEAQIPSNISIDPYSDLSDRGTKKFGDVCAQDRECGFAGSYCEPKINKCACRKEFEATNHIDKCGHSVNVNESCFFHEQCEAKVSQTECRDGRCICIFEKIPTIQPDGVIVCVAEHKEPPSLQYIDPAMIGVLVGMALMFIIICVVLRLFSKARWRENRTIFNTPNARLMNVSLLRENKLLHAQDRRGSRASVRVPSRQPSMASLRAHSPNASQGSRTGSRRGSRGSSGNASAVSTKSNKSPPNHPNNVADPVLENVTVEILEPKA